MMRRALLLSSLVLAASSVAAVSACSSSSSPAAPSGGDDGGDGDAGAVDAATGDSNADAAEASLDDPPIPAAFQAFATAFDAERKKLGASGAAVAILQDGQVTFAHGFGTKGPKSTDPVRARTLFRIGSMTKSLTATAFMTLVQEGKADPTATLKSVVPDVALNTASCATCAATLTLHELLSHQSGLDDYIVLDAGSDDSLLSGFLTGTVFQGNDYFMEPSGSFWNYANPNFYLVGLAVERAAGVPYRQAVQQRVLTPLGMTRTFFLPSDVTADGDFTDGSSTDPTTGAPWDVTPSSYDNAWARPAGYAFSSVLDYARFVQFLDAGAPAVLADAQRKQLLGKQVSTDELASDEQYGYGLFVDTGFHIGNDWYPLELVQHGGDIPGFASDFYLVPSTGFGIVTFANADGAHFNTSLAVALGMANLPAPTTVPGDLVIDPTTFPKLAGTYFDPNNVGHVVITVSATNAVSVSMPDLDAAKVPYTTTLAPASPNNFTYTVQGQPVLVTFIPDATGADQWFRTRYFVAKAQLPGGMPKPALKVDAPRLRARLRARL